MVIVIISSVVLTIIGFLTQIAVFPALGATVIGPNMIIVMAVVLAMIFGPWPALAVGFFGGLLVDLMAGGAVAISSFIPIIAGFFLGIYRKEINSTHFAWAMIFAALSHLAHDIWSMGVLYFGRITLFISWGTLLRMIISAVETGLFAGVIFLIITKLITLGSKRKGLPYLQRY